MYTGVISFLMTEPLKMISFSNYIIPRLFIIFHFECEYTHRNIIYNWIITHCGEDYEEIVIIVESFIYFHNLEYNNEI